MAKDDDNTGVDLIPEKVDKEAPEEKQRDERFVEEEQK